MSRRLIYWFFVFASASLLVQACSVLSKSQKDKESTVDSNSNLLIYIQRGTCKGKCPVYEASFYTGKKMTYQGVSRMPLIGKYQYLVPDELVKNLIFEAVKLNLAQVPDSTAVPEGAQKTRIRIVINGVMKQIIGNSETGDENFKKYVKLLHTEVNAMIVEQEGIKLP